MHPARTTGDNADSGIVERCSDRREIAPIDAHVAVREDEDIVARRPEHVFEVCHLLIRGSDARTDDERDITGRQIANQGMSDRNGAVGPVVDAEHNLEDGVILLGKGAQIFIQTGLGAVQRLQYRDRGLRASTRKRPPGEADGRNHRADEISPSGNEEDRDDDSRTHRRLGQAFPAWGFTCRIA